MHTVGLCALMLLLQGSQGSQCTDTSLCEDVPRRYIAVITTVSPDFNGEIITFDEANAYCQQTLNSTGLALVQGDEDQQEAREECSRGNHREKCWIGVRTNVSFFGLGNGDRMWRYINGELISQYEEFFFNETIPWGMGEPSTETNTEADVNTFFRGEDCVFLNSEADNYPWADSNCNGTNPLIPNSIQVRGFLCENPLHQEGLDCLCECQSCKCDGDPHCGTFDGLIHHFQGNCTYLAVTPCGVNETTRDYNQTTGLPFTVSARFRDCFREGFSCVFSLFLSFYAADGTIDDEIILTEGPVARHTQDDSAVAIGELIAWSQGKYRVIEGRVETFDVLDVEIFVTCVNAPICESEDQFSDAIVRYNGDLGEAFQGFGIGYEGYFDVWLTECFTGRSCGLCGTNNFDESDDFTTNDGRQLNTTNQERVRSMGQNEWDILNEFGHSWLSPPRLVDGTVCRTVSDPICVDDDVCCECLEEAEEWCADIDCPAQCGGNFVVQKCATDYCVLSNCTSNCDPNDSVEECLRKLGEDDFTDVIRDRCVAECNPLLETESPTSDPSTPPTSGSPTGSPTEVNTIKRIWWDQTDQEADQVLASSKTKQIVWDASLYH